MITEDLEKNKMCLFCASDYHLEMILLPYIKERINNSKFIILTEDNLEATLNTLLEKINIKDIEKTTIRNLSWQTKNSDYIENIKEDINENDNINIIINGKYNYIKSINNELKKNINQKMNIINCFHISDPNVDIESISKDYKYILNTRKIDEK